VAETTGISEEEKAKEGDEKKLTESQGELRIESEGARGAS